MSYEENDEIEEGFKIGGEDDEDLDMPNDLDFGLDEEDPDKDH